MQGYYTLRVGHSRNNGPLAWGMQLYWGAQSSLG